MTPTGPIPEKGSEIDSALMTNRERARQPRGKMFYCECDKTMANGGRKCPTCHRRPGKQRAKKPVPLP
jgi:hypothetical protein